MVTIKTYCDSDSLNETRRQIRDQLLTFQQAHGATAEVIFNTMLHDATAEIPNGYSAPVEDAMSDAQALVEGPAWTRYVNTVQW